MVIQHEMVRWPRLINDAQDERLRTRFIEGIAEYIALNTGTNPGTPPLADNPASYVARGRGKWSGQLLNP